MRTARRARGHRRPVGTVEERMVSELRGTWNRIALDYTTASDEAGETITVEDVRSASADYLDSNDAEVFKAFWDLSCDARDAVLAKAFPEGSV